MLPLTSPAIEILKERQQVSKSPYVCPGKGEKGYLADPKKAWKQVLKRGNVLDLHFSNIVPS
ncbi:MAG: hypothetical protein FJX03_00115 [Alphaproteobacteria bacterium]|nr:hypothetical protein [Alphaproteobacteria bacterium]